MSDTEDTDRMTDPAQCWLFGRAGWTDRNHYAAVIRFQNPSRLPRLVISDRSVGSGATVVRQNGSYLLVGGMYADPRFRQAQDEQRDGVKLVNLGDSLRYALNGDFSDCCLLFLSCGC